MKIKASGAINLGFGTGKMAGLPEFSGLGNAGLNPTHSFGVSTGNLYKYANHN